jgi:single-stranded-DNA-specific exonuclease
VDDLARLAPFGPGNPPLTLVATRLRVGPGGSTVGRGKEHRILRMVDEAGASHTVVWWNAGTDEPPEGLVDLAYVARASSYKGTRELQVQLVALRTSEGAGPVEVRSLEVIDHRHEPSPRSVLDDILTGGDVTVWREADGEVDGVDRAKLAPCATLVIWTAPPGPDELRAGLETAQPQRVHLFAQDPGMDRPGPFERRLAGLVKHVLNARGGETSLSELAAATAQSEAAVRLGLQRLVVRGLILMTEGRDGRLTLTGGDNLPAPEVERTRVAARLHAALQETAAFRAHVRTADKDLLVRTGGRKPQ